MNRVSAGSPSLHEPANGRNVAIPVPHGGGPRVRSHRVLSAGATRQHECGHDVRRDLQATAVDEEPARGHRREACAGQPALCLVICDLGINASRHYPSVTTDVVQKFVVPYVVPTLLAAAGLPFVAIWAIARRISKGLGEYTHLGERKENLQAPGGRECAAPIDLQISATIMTVIPYFLA